VIADQVAAVRERIARAAERAGRAPGDVTLLAVAKTFPPDAVREAVAAGVTHIGENRVQEAEPKIAAVQDLAGKVTWHLVGHLQTNKAKKAVSLFHRIDSVDRLELAGKLEHYAAQAGRILPVLVQVDLAGEATKFGLDQDHVFPALEALRGFKSVRAEGLLILPPYADDPEASRPFFRRLRGLRDQALSRGLLLGSELSMGMSHDLEVAVEEGATTVRVGTAIFGARPRR
jgi:hypothetical protein